MRHILKHAIPERLYGPREVVAKSLRCRKSGEFGGASFLHVSPIAIIKKIKLPRCVLSSIRARTLQNLDPPPRLSQAFIAFGRRDFPIRPVPFEGRPMLHLPIVAFKMVDDRPGNFVLFILLPALQLVAASATDGNLMAASGERHGLACTSVRDCHRNRATW
jgi:hypothetical protein